MRRKHSGFTLKDALQLLRVQSFVPWVMPGNSLPASDHLASAGLGLRYTAGSLGVSAEWGRIVSGSVLAPNPAYPKTGDNKFHVSLTARF